MWFLLGSVAVGVFVTMLLVPAAKTFLNRSGIVGVDQQKADKPEIPTSGGIAVLFGFLLATTAFIGMQTFIVGEMSQNTFMLAGICSVLIISLIGLLDDVHVLDEAREVKEEHQRSVGFERWWIKPLFVLPAALPLMVVQAGETMMVLPIVGAVEWGIVYPLVLVPIGVVTVSNATNMLAGQNGLATGMGAITLTSLGIFSVVNGYTSSAVIALGMAGSLWVFFYHNRYPASILPGDSLTYGIGAVFAVATILGNVQTYAVFIFVPWMIEAFLKLRSRFQASSLGALQEDGTLRSKHEKIYSLTHVAMWYELTEPQIVRVFMAGQAVVCLIGFWLFL